jgi:hypothetical protein
MIPASSVGTTAPFGLPKMAASHNAQRGGMAKEPAVHPPEFARTARPGLVFTPFHKDASAVW